MATTLGTLVVARYESEHRAQVILDTVSQMAHGESSGIIEAAMLLNDLNGHLHSRETNDLPAAKGARRRVIMGGLLGGVCPAGLRTSAMADGIGGALLGKLWRTGIIDAVIAASAERRGAGKATIVVLSRNNAR